jgi:hypothetical protein
VRSTIPEPATVVDRSPRRTAIPPVADVSATVAPVPSICSASVVLPPPTTVVDALVVVVVAANVVVGATASCVVVVVAADVPAAVVDVDDGTSEVVVVVTAVFRGRDAALDGTVTAPNVTTAATATVTARRPAAPSAFPNITILRTRFGGDAPSWRYRHRTAFLESSGGLPRRKAPAGQMSNWVGRRARRPARGR